MTQCEFCGATITKQEMAEKKAFKLQGKLYCLNCRNKMVARKSQASAAAGKGAQRAGGRPGKATPARKGRATGRPGTRRIATGRRPASRLGKYRTASATGEGEEGGIAARRPRKKGNAPLFIGIGAGVAVVGVVLAFMLGGNSTGPKDSSDTTSDSSRGSSPSAAKEAYDMLLRFLDKNRWDAKACLEKLQETKPKVRGTAFEAKVAEEERKYAQRVMELREEEDALVKTIEELEAQVENPENPDELYQRLRELEKDETLIGTEVAMRVTRALSKLLKNIVDTAIEKASEFESANPDDYEAALERWYEAEETSLKYGRPWKELHKKIVRSSNRLAEKLYQTLDFESVPWTDLVNPPHGLSWQETGAVEFTVEEGVMVVTGKETGDPGKLGVIKIGMDEKWRDLVLELDFTVLNAGFTIFLRYGRSKERVDIMTGPNAAFTKGESATLTITIKGSDFNLEGSAGDAYTIDELGARRGGIGLGFAPGARAKFTKLRVRILQ